ncbi:AmmeMemoRadiSam system protein B [candidate division KSB1 bacterium]
MKKYALRLTILLLIIYIPLETYAQIPLERVLSRVTVPSGLDTRGLVDIVGFPGAAEQMDYIGALAEEIEKDNLNANMAKFNLDEDTGFLCGICPHDDYALAARVYVHVQKYIKAKTVILIGNAHWSEAFGIRDRIILGDFSYWRGPYGNVKVSEYRDQIIENLPDDSYIVNRLAVETEHSLEALIPYMQYFNRDVEIIPILVSFMDWDTMDRRGVELAQAVAGLIEENGLKYGEDIAVLISTDGQHYGDYGWSYYDYHPHGCDAKGYNKATELDNKLVKKYLAGKVNSGKVKNLFSRLVDQDDVSNYKITWCGRFAAPFGVNFANHLNNRINGRDLEGVFLRYGTSISDPWLDLSEYGLGLTGDANLHHFVTYFAVGYR